MFLSLKKESIDCIICLFKFIFGLILFLKINEQLIYLYLINIFLIFSVAQG